ncbi:MAG TPA: glycosyltransferase family 39 protein, partial [Acidimicrobiales bacterium]|nr:glycosyltransferase family 39 protein [Acidimicrobiales bacterium]
MSPSSPRTAGRDIERAQIEEAGALLERRAGTWKNDAAAIVGLLVLGVVLPAVVGLWAHSLSIPRNDDWAYRRVLFDFVRTGHYSLVGWGSMTLVGQILWSAPFVLVLGPRPWVPSLAVALLAAAGVAAAYLLSRAQLGRAKAFGAVLLLIALPGFALSTVDFMTDVPALSAEMVCLLLGAFALRSIGPRQSLWLALSMGAGVFGFSVREFDFAAPGAVLVTIAWSDRRKLKVCAIWAAALVVACGAIYLWTAGLPEVQPKAFSLPGAVSWVTLGGAYFTLSFFLSPVLPGALRRWGLFRRPLPCVPPAV